MPKKYGTFSESLIIAIGQATGFFTWPLEYTEAWRWKQLKSYKNKKIYDGLYHLKNQGLVKEISKNGKRFLELTQKGQLEELLLKAHTPNEASGKWDGKWRLAIFDIPEDAKGQRDKLRHLLKDQGFKMLQASVFISPEPLNRAAVDYLNHSGLASYIRFARIDEMDNDKDLRRKFKLT